MGQYLQDKYGALIGPFLIKEGTGIRMERDLSVSNMMKWAATGRYRHIYDSKKLKHLFRAKAIIFIIFKEA